MRPGSQTVVFNPLERAHYVASAHDLPQLPADTGREVAFAGRSNAGKSSAINALAGRNRLAFVSKTPGRTQLVNFFETGDGQFLVDLPGYGYAKVPEAERMHWKHLVGGYLQARRGVCGLIAIMDVRHPLTPLDRDLLDWFLPSGRPVHILLTKADKLSRQQASAQLASVRRDLTGQPRVTAQLFSSLKNTGLDEARAIIAGWLGLPEAPKENPRHRGDVPGRKP